MSFNQISKYKLELKVQLYNVLYYLPILYYNNKQYGVIYYNTRNKVYNQLVYNMPHTHLEKGSYCACRTSS